MRGLIGAAVVAVAVVLQLAVADRITFPGGTGPDLVLLTVAALALAIGPMAGAILGFCAGLALDVAPPAGHLVGQDALVFCLIGYICGLVAAGPAAEGLPEQEHSALFELGVTAAGAVCGEAMTAGLGVMLSDPRVTWPAIKQVLPVAAGYDLLLSPFVLLTVAAMLRVAGFVRPREASAGMAVRPAAWAARPAAAGAVRQMSGGAGSPRLHLSGQGKGGDGWLGGGRGGSAGSRSGPGRSGLSGPGNSRPGAGRREPRLKLGASGGTRRSGGKAGSGPGHGHGQGRVRFGGRRGEGVVGGSLLGFAGSGRPAGSGRTVGFRRAGDKLASSRFGASLLGGSVFGRSSSAFGRSMSPFGRSSATFGGSVGLSGRVSSGAAGFTGKGLRGRAKSGSLAKSGSGAAAHAPRFRKGNALVRVVNDGRRPSQRKSPSRGWLRGSRPGRGPVRSLASNGLRRRTPGRGWLRGTGGGAVRGGSGGGLRGGGLRGGGLRIGGVGGGGLGLGGGRKNGLGGRSPFKRKSSLAGVSGASRKSPLGGKSLRIGKSGLGGLGGPSRMRTGRSKKSWRRTGGYR